MKKGMFSPGARRPQSEFEAALLLADVAPVAEPQIQEETVVETAFFESISDDAMFEAINKAAVVNRRAESAAAVIQWVEDGDAEFDALDAILYGLAGGRDDEDLTDEASDEYNLLMGDAADFMVNACGASVSDVEAMFEGDDDKAEAVFGVIETATSGDASEMIAEFSVRESMMMEAAKKVIRDGKVVTINTNRRKRRMSAAQKSALKKARRKANSSAAKAARKKSMRQRKSRGM